MRFLQKLCTSATLSQGYSRIMHVIWMCKFKGSLQRPCALIGLVFFFLTQVLLIRCQMCWWYSMRFFPHHKSLMSLFLKKTSGFASAHCYIMLHVCTIKPSRFEKLQQEIIQLFSFQTSHDTFDLDLSKLQLMSYYILFPDLDAKDKEELSESQGPLEDSTHLSSASSHGRRIRWLLSSASLGNIEEEMTSVEPRLESSASGATLEVRNTCIYN